MRWRSTFSGGIEDAKNYAIGARALGDFDVATHDVEFFLGVTKIPGARSNDRMQTDRNSGSDCLHEANAGNDAAFQQITAQFNSLCSASFCCHRGCNRLDTDFDKQMFGHDLVKVAARVQRP